MIEDRDPVAAPEAYRRSLLAALGDDDPAVAQRETPPAIRSLVVEVGSLLRVRAEPGEWSALECVATSSTRSSSQAPANDGSSARTNHRSSGTTRRCGSTGSGTTRT